jgi:hypothetical protein
MSDILNQLKSLKTNPKAGAVSAEEHKMAKSRLMFALGADTEVTGETAFSFTTFVLRNFISKPIAASAAALVLAVGSLSTVSAAADSLPGDTLYSVKIMTEQAQLKLVSLDRRAVLHTEFAERRLREANELTEKGDENPVHVTLARAAMVEYKSELSKASEDLKQLKDNVQTPATLAAVNEVKNTIAGMETVIDEKVASSVTVADGEAALSAKDATKETSKVATTVAVDVHEDENSEVTEKEMKEMFRSELGDIEARQTFNKHRLERLEQFFKENEKLFTDEEMVSSDSFKKMAFVIKQSEFQIPEAMNGFAAGGYRTAFEVLRGIDAELLALESDIAEIEITVTAAVERERVAAEEEKETEGEAVVPVEEIVTP